MAMAKIEGVKSIFSKFLKLTRNPFFGFVGSIVIFFGVWYIATFHERKFYNASYNCAKVIKIIKVSDYKGRPSIILQDKKAEYELYQAYGYDYDFNLFTIGDRISKQAESFEFIRTGKDKSIDTIKYEAAVFLSSLIGFNIQPYQGEGVNCNCFKNDSINNQSFMHK